MLWQEVAIVYWFIENAGIHWGQMEMSSDVFPFLFLSGVLFFFRIYVGISHPNELQVVSNYAFSWNVYVEKNLSIPEFLSEDITLLRKDFTLNWDMLQGGDTRSSDYETGTLNRNFLG